jgi:hypothetical protein
MAVSKRSQTAGNRLKGYVRQGAVVIAKENCGIGHFTENGGLRDRNQVSRARSRAECATRALSEQPGG